MSQEISVKFGIANFIGLAMLAASPNFAFVLRVDKVDGLLIVMFD